jgi:hypothetical protein
LAYQPPASSTFLSEQTSHQQPASNTFSQNKLAPAISHQPNEQDEYSKIHSSYDKKCNMFTNLKPNSQPPV